MKTNVEYLDRQLFVNEEKKTVACKLLSKVTIPELYSQLIYDYLYGNEFTNYLSKKLKESIVEDGSNSYEILIKTTGVAKCSNDDDFNQAVGEMIAITKAQREAFKIAEDIFTFIMKEFKKMLSDLDSLIKGTHKAYKDCGSHTKEIYDDYKSLLETADRMSQLIQAKESNT